MPELTGQRAMHSQDGKQRVKDAEGDIVARVVHNWLLHKEGR